MASWGVLHVDASIAVLTDAVIEAWGDAYGMSEAECLRELGELKKLKRLHGGAARAAVQDDGPTHQKKRAINAEMWWRIWRTERDRERIPIISGQIAKQWAVSTHQTATVERLFGTAERICSEGASVGRDEERLRVFSHGPGTKDGPPDEWVDEWCEAVGVGRKKRRCGDPDARDADGAAGGGRKRRSDVGGKRARYMTKRAREQESALPQFPSVSASGT